MFDEYHLFFKIDSQSSSLIDTILVQLQLLRSREHLASRLSICKKSWNSENYG